MNDAIVNGLFRDDEADLSIPNTYRPKNRATVVCADRLDMLRRLPDESAMLVATSPPYNIGKKYERRTDLDGYLEDQDRTIAECIRVLHPRGSICWQVGNHVDGGEIYPLDVLLYRSFKERGLALRNRIVWHYEHGLNCSRRFSGRYETVNWFTKGEDYVFHLDPVRVPQKYPGKRHYKGPKMGEFSCNPRGKNPGDVWVIPNVKHNHVEKTEHPCQFPVELIERLVLALTDPGDLVLDPYLGTGTAICAAVLHGRRGIGSEIAPEYARIARGRVAMALSGRLPVRHMGTEVYKPTANTSVALRPADWERGGPPT